VTKTRLAIFLGGVAVLAALAIHAGLPAMERAFALLGFHGFGLVLLIHIPVMVLLGMAWWWIGRSLSGATPIYFAAARLVRDSVAELLPFSQVGGFAAGVRLLSLTGLNAQTGVFSLFADLLMEFFSKLLYAAAGVAMLAALRPTDNLASYLVSALAVMGISSLGGLFLRDRLLDFVIGALERWTPSGAETRPALTPFLNYERLAPSYVLHAICWGLGGVEAWVTLRLMGMPVTVLEALTIDSLATSLRTFGFWVPAAMGVQEVAYVLACGLLGLGPGGALAFSLVRRARDLLLGSAGLALWQALEIERIRRSREFAVAPDN
jgi:glycosyltransferase 2 family protein